MREEFSFFLGYVDKLASQLRVPLASTYSVLCTVTLYTNIFKHYSLRVQINRIWILVASWIDTFWIHLNVFTSQGNRPGECLYNDVRPPDPPLASFSNDQFAAIEAVMATYAHVGCRQLLQGVNVQLCRLLATIFASTIAPRLPWMYSNSIPVNFE